MADGDTLTLSLIAKQFSDEEAAWLFLEQTKWPNGPVCPHCGAADSAYYLAPKGGERRTRKGTVSYRRLWKCAACRQPFTVLVGTVMEHTQIPVSKWLLAIHLLNAGKNGVSALELSRQLGIGYRAAWFMAHRIRHGLAPAAEAPQKKLSGTVEADETYIGGRAHGKRGRGAENKTPVFSLIERGGDVHSRVVANVTGETLAAVMREQVATADTVLMTDTFAAYDKPGKEFAAHESVDHGQKEYAKDTPHGRAHTNTAEGYFSQLKRSLDGTYHHVSAHHLHRYLAEFDHRYNTRKAKDGERTVKALRKMAGKRLLYQQTRP
jgi:transposase-like protein